MCDISKQLESLFSEFTKRENIKYFDLKGSFNPCYNFYDLYIKINNIPCFVELLGKYGLLEYTEYHGDSKGQGMIRSEPYRSTHYRHEYYSLRLWVNKYKKAKEPLDVEKMLTMHNKHFEYMGRYGLTINHSVWFKWFCNREIVESDIQLEDECIIYHSKNDSMHKSFYRNTTPVTVNGKCTFLYKQSGYERDNFSSLLAIISVLIPNSTLSKVYTAYDSDCDRSKSNFVFLNDGSFFEEEFAEYINSNFKGVRTKTTNKPKNKLSEREEIEKEIAKLQRKLKKIKE